VDSNEELADAEARCDPTGVSYDLWFWKPTTPPHLDVDELMAWFGEAELEFGDWSEETHTECRLKGAPHPGLAPFDPASVADVLRSELPGSLDGEEAPLMLSFTRQAGLALYGSVSVARSAVDSLADRFVTTVTRFGLTVFDPQEDAIHPACPARKFWFQMESRWTVGDPSLEHVLGALEDLGESEPSFAILESTTGDYVQVAGSPSALTVEWRSHARSSFVHTVAGRPEAGSGGHARVRRSGRVESVQSNEDLGLDHARTIFACFYRVQMTPMKGRGTPDAASHAGLGVMPHVTLPSAGRPAWEAARESRRER
jgi:hypothetical protein